MKRRARRRLVGAIALVVFVVIALPIVLDREPKPVPQDLRIEIPSQDAGTFSSRVLPAEPPHAGTAVEAPKPEARPEAKAPDARASEPAAKSEAEAPKPAAAQARAEAKPAAAPVKDAPKASAAAQAKAAAESFMVPLGMFSKADNVRQVRAKAGAAGFKTFTEPVAGSQNVRVRAGPFPSRDAAEKARDKLKGAGLDVGAVAER